MLTKNRLQHVLYSSKIETRIIGFMAELHQYLSVLFIIIIFNNKTCKQNTSKCIYFAVLRAQPRLCAASAFKLFAK